MTDEIRDKSGIVCILKNEAMPGYVKIGMATDLKQRMKDLDTTGVPLSFECHYARRVEDMAFVEHQLHAAFADKRVRKSREFFQILPEQARAALEIARGEPVTVDEQSSVETPDDFESIQKAKTRRPNFRFSMLNVKPGTVLVHTNDANATCTVYDDRNVLFRDHGHVLGQSARLIF